MDNHCLVYRFSWDSTQKPDCQANLGATGVRESQFESRSMSTNNIDTRIAASGEWEWNSPNTRVIVRNHCVIMFDSGWWHGYTKNCQTHAGSLPDARICSRTAADGMVWLFGSLLNALKARSHHANLGPFNRPSTMEMLPQGYCNGQRARGCPTTQSAGNVTSGIRGRPASDCGCYGGPTTARSFQVRRKFVSNSEHACDLIDVVVGCVAGSAPDKDIPTGGVPDLLQPLEEPLCLQHVDTSCMLHMS